MGAHINPLIIIRDCCRGVKHPRPFFPLHDPRQHLTHDVCRAASTSDRRQVKDNSTGGNNDNNFCP